MIIAVKDIAKQFFLSILLIFFTGSVYSQSGDSAFMKAVYTLKRMPDSTNPNLISKDLFVLEIGSFITKFYSYYKQAADSILLEQYNAQRNFGESTISADMRGIPTGSAAVFYRSISNNIFICSDELGVNRYKYIDTLGSMKWLIMPDTASFLGYKCTKATVRFRGRDYIAWFTPEIPVSAGPFKFFGLPGLIMSIADVKENFEFKLTSIETLSVKKPLVMQEKKTILVTRKEFKKLVKFMITDMDGFAASQGFEFHTKSINGDTNPPPPPKIPYNPIELE